jgi:hypothetical protein
VAEAGVGGELAGQGQGLGEQGGVGGGEPMPAQLTVGAVAARMPRGRDTLYGRVSSPESLPYLLHSPDHS